MKILYISYSCDPYNGSEDQIGFNVPLSSFRSGHDVTVLTKIEHKKNIEDYLINNSDVTITFHYADVSTVFKRILKGLLYSLRIVIWQSVAEKIAYDLCEQESYDIIHQVAPIEFRAIGNYGRLSIPKYILGPIGGGFEVPKGLRSYTRKYFLIEYLRRILNYISFIMLRMSSKLDNCYHVYFTNEETKQAFESHGIKIDVNSWTYHCDIGVSSQNIVLQKNDVVDRIVFLVPGRLNYRKGHQMLFDSIPRQLSNIDFVFRIVGTGPLEKKLKRYVRNDEFLSNHVVFVGKIDYTEMNREYDNSNVVILPSLSEATGTVLIEAMSRSKPVITGNYFGAKLLVDDTCSWTFSGNNKKDVIESLQKCIINVLMCPEELNEKGKNAYEISKKYTWDEKIRLFNKVYQKSKVV